MTKLIMAIMYAQEETLNQCKQELTTKYGPIQKENTPYNFDYTQYYEEEFGTNLKKQFIIFQKEIQTDQLATIKHEITAIEALFTKNNKRTINIDPGYLTASELTLASFKPRNQVKEEIAKDIYAHTVIEVINGKPQTFPHTFRDYKEHLNFFFPQE
jgi:hypothetical protein|tara:strand:+ start:256 stop:726 length:471 start_codon:yes stop_codon:yes gene_type:complete